MASRKTVHVVLREAADPGQSPHSTIGQITAYVRVAYPPHVHWVDVALLLERATWQLVTELRPPQDDQALDHLE